MVAQDIVARAVERAPNVHEALVTINRSAEVTHLENELDLFRLHVLDEGSEALFAIVHDVLMDISNQPEPKGARRFRSSSGAPWPR
jgi:hypothetical protein